MKHIAVLGILCAALGGCVQSRMVAPLPSLSNSPYVTVYCARHDNSFARFFGIRREYAYCPGGEREVSQSEYEQIVRKVKLREQAEERDPSQGPKTSSGQSDSSEPKSSQIISSGSAFFVSSSGYALTNAHVVDNCSRITMTLRGETRAEVALVSADARNDLAILRSLSRPKGVAVFRASDAARAGDEVVAVGFPLAPIFSPEPTISTGIISALSGLNGDSTQYRTSAPVQSGNSGGPLLDRSGRVVGVVVSKLDALRIAKITGDIPQNVNFAIKASVALGFLETQSIAPSTERRTKEQRVAEIAEEAAQFTALVECWR